jgi:hypothetical protein
MSVVGHPGQIWTRVNENAGADVSVYLLSPTDFKHLHQVVIAEGPANQQAWIFRLA